MCELCDTDRIDLVAEAQMDATASDNAAWIARDLAVIEDRIKALRDAFDAAKKVELARIAKRNAELDIQRFTDMVQRKAAESYLLRLPPPPP